MAPIVVIAGQSNAAGRATLPLVPAAFGYATPFAPVQHMYRVEDGPTDPLVWDFDEGPEDLDYIHSGNGTFGIELSLGRRLHRAGYEHSICKMAIGSTSLAVHWLPTGTFPAGDNLFAQFLAYCTQAETDLEGEIAELVWVQGEADAANESRANAYAANLRALILAFRVAFPGVPVTINRLHARCSQPYTTTVRAAQDLVARTVPGIRIISADNFALPDGSHYNTMGFITLGEAFADAILSGRSGTGISTGARSGVSGLDFSTGPNFPPAAAWSSSAAALEVTFTDESSDLEGSITRWSWDFGDGDTSTTQSPVHTYDAPGTYSVTLTASDSRGRLGRKTASVTVIATQWAVDATSGKAVPADSTEWDALVAAETLSVGTPARLWLFQEASGNLADAIGGKTLTASGTPLYQQAESGWSRYFMTSNTGAAAANRFANNATMAATTSSVMLLMYGRIVAPVNAHQRMFYGGASSNAFEAVAGGSLIRIRVGAQAGNGASSHAGSVRPYVLVHDVTHSLSILYSNIEKRAITFAARSGTTVQFQWSISTDATSNTAIGYGAAWEGAAAEFADATAADAAVRALLESLGWVVTGW